MSGSQTNHSFERFFFGDLVEAGHQIGLGRLKQFAARAAQKLLNQNSL